MRELLAFLTEHCCQDAGGCEPPGPCDTASEPQ